MAKKLKDWIAYTLESSDSWAPKLEKEFEVCLPEIKPDFDKDIVLGCGAFGCALSPTGEVLSEPWVLKITSDEEEGPMQAAIGVLQKQDKVYPVLRGMTIVRGVARWNPRNLEEWFPHDEVFFIVRENIVPLVDLCDAEMCPMSEQELEHLTDTLYLYREDLKSGLYDEARNHIDLIHHNAPEVAEALQFFHDHDNGDDARYALRDVHIGNVGLRIIPGMVDESDPNLGLGDIVIFDPGLTESPEDVEFEVARVNPNSDTLLDMVGRVEIVEIS